MRLFKLIFVFVPYLVFSQNQCYFNSYNKKGGSHLFSIYYEPNLSNPLNGVCDTKANGKLYEHRVFKEGKIIEETLNYFNGIKHIETATYSNLDSIVAIFNEYWESGNPKSKRIFYYNKEQRRCEYYTDYHLNGNKRFVYSYAYARLSEITEWEVKDHPPHTIDYDGFTTLHVPFGIALEYSIDGKLVSKTHHKMILSRLNEQHSKEGEFEEYHANGKIKTKGYYSNGKPDKDWIIYNYYGKKIEENYYSKNLKVGTWKAWFDNGNKKYEYYYDTLSNHMFKPSKKEWDENGKLILQHEIDKSGNGFIKKWNRAGILIYYSDFLNNDNIKTTEVHYYDNGLLKSKINNNKNADTFYVAYHDNGKIQDLRTHKTNGDEATVKHMEWNKLGQLLIKIDKISKPNFELFESTEYYDNGNLKHVVQHKNNERVEEFYFTNGFKKKSLLYHNSLLQGSFQEFDSLGNILVNYKYKNGIRDGKCLRYNSQGNILFEQVYIDGCPQKNLSKKNVNRRDIKDLNKTEQAKFYSLVYNYLQNKAFYQSSSKYYTKKEIDTLANCYLWLHDEWVNYAVFPYPHYLYEGQKVIFYLPEAYFKGLDIKDTTNNNVKELLKILKELNWKIPSWKKENGNYTATYNVTGFCTKSFINYNFSKWQNYISISLIHSQVEIENKFGYQKSPTIQLERYSNCLFKAKVHVNSRNIDFNIYNDGEIEFDGQQNNWNDLNEIHDFSNDLPYD